MEKVVSFNAGRPWLAYYVLDWPIFSSIFIMEQENSSCLMAVTDSEKIR